MQQGQAPLGRSAGVHLARHDERTECGQHREQVPQFAGLEHRGLHRVDAQTDRAPSPGFVYRDKDWVGLAVPTTPPAMVPLCRSTMYSTATAHPVGRCDPAVDAVVTIVV